MQASLVMAHGLSYPMASGIFPDKGSNPCPLHWQADSQPLNHQGSPLVLHGDTSMAGLALGKAASAVNKMVTW